MKGLIRKDLYMAVSCSKTYLIICVLFLVMGAFGEPGAFILAYPIMLSSMIPVTLLSYDEHDHWNDYSCTLPYTRAQLVTVKYIMGGLGALSVWILTILVQGLRMGVSGDFTMGPFLGQMLLLLSAGLLPPAFCLPFIFKLGSEKGRLAYMVSLGLFCGLAFVLGEIPTEGGMALSPILPVLIALGVYLISWRVSIRIYEKREL